MCLHLWRVMRASIRPISIAVDGVQFESLWSLRLQNFSSETHVPKQLSNSGHSLKGRFRLVAKGLPPKAWRKIEGWRMCVSGVVAFLGLGALQNIALI